MHPIVFLIAAILAPGLAFADEFPSDSTSNLAPVVTASASRQYLKGPNGYEFSMGAGIALTNGPRDKNPDAPLMRLDITLGYQTVGEFSKRVSIRPSWHINGGTPLYLRVHAPDLVEIIQDRELFSMGASLGVMLGSTTDQVFVEAGVIGGGEAKILAEVRMGVVHRFDRW